MKVELLLERSANVIVHQHVKRLMWAESAVSVLTHDGRVATTYALRNLSWIKEIHGDTD